MLNISGTDLERKMVRKVNILVPIYDDSCFNYCGGGVDEGMECKRKFCTALSEYLELVLITILFTSLAVFCYCRN